MGSFACQSVALPYKKAAGEKLTTGVKTTDHKDTFDRMLIAHALTGKHSVVSPDTLFPFYEPLGLNVIWK